MSRYFCKVKQSDVKIASLNRSGYGLKTVLSGGPDEEKKQTLAGSPHKKTFAGSPQVCKQAIDKKHFYQMFCF